MKTHHCLNDVEGLLFQIQIDISNKELTLKGVESRLHFARGRLRNIIQDIPNEARCTCARCADPEGK